MAKGKGGCPKKLLTVSAHFRQSLDLLMERVFSASPHFVRCIKPNQKKKPLRCDDDFMMKQLKYTGMLEAVRVRREGYAYRPYYSDFFNCYRGIAFRFSDLVSTISPSRLLYIILHTVKSYTRLIHGRLEQFSKAYIINSCKPT